MPDVPFLVGEDPLGVTSLCIEALSPQYGAVSVFTVSDYSRVPCPAQVEWERPLDPRELCFSLQAPSLEGKRAISTGISEVFFLSISLSPQGSPVLLSGPKMCLPLDSSSLELPFDLSLLWVPCNFL